MTLETPVALLIYNRPVLTSQVLTALARVEPRRVFVVGDGPKQGCVDDQRRVADTRALITRFAESCEVDTLYAPVNLGLKRRVASGLDWVFEQVDQAIVLEDDCLPDPSFFTFCEQMLDRYRDDERVLSIGGANFQQHVTPSASSYYFSKYFRCWGWASWRRAWEHMDVSMKEWPQWREAERLKEVAESSREERFWRKIFDAVSTGEIESWSYAFMFASFCRNGLHVQPTHNLVSNLGFDEDATHTRQANHRFANFPLQRLTSLTHPPTVKRDIKADQYTFSDVYQGGRLPGWRRHVNSLAKRLKRLAQVKQHISCFRRRLRLRRQVAQTDAKRIIVGAGGVEAPGWISTDIKDLNLLVPRDWEFQFSEDSLDAILAEHVWEHLTFEQGTTAARNCFRFLKPGGYLRVAVPDGLHPAADYINWVRPHGKGPGAADHKILFTHSTLSYLFQCVGFETRLLEYFDERGRFHESHWDPGDGPIQRSRRFDKRNAGGKTAYTSIILDAVKPLMEPPLMEHPLEPPGPKAIGSSPRSRAA